MVTMVGLVSPEPIIASSRGRAGTPTHCLLTARRPGSPCCTDAAAGTLLSRSDVMRSPAMYFSGVTRQFAAVGAPAVVRPTVNHGDMHKIDVAERRRRLAVRHALAPAHRVNGTPPDPPHFATHLLALHSTDPATVYLSVLARIAAPVPARAI